MGEGGPLIPGDLLPTPRLMEGLRLEMQPKAGVSTAGGGAVAILVREFTVSSPPQKALQGQGGP